tara:strand:- start:7894 stop:8157 length:264 start_codon:yes stop_codon:yes gene_type:complete
MLNKITKIIYLVSFLIFIILLLFYYFSEKNIIKTNKSRSYHNSKIELVTMDLPLLINDTDNIIEYKDDTEVYKKNKKKYFFWELINK